MAETYESHPSLLRLRELETLTDMGRNANARLYLGGVDRPLGSAGSGAGARGNGESRDDRE